jgi:hypothetical protein
MYDSAPMETFGFDPQEATRFKLLAKLSSEQLRKAAERFNQIQYEVARESTHFIEKLAIGSGATIAALVSFLGAQHATIRPHWILRTALVSLATVVVAALYHTFRYPYYKRDLNHKLWLEADRKDRQQQYNEYHYLYQYGNPTIDVDTGQPIDFAEWTDTFNKRDAELASSIQFRKKEEEHWWRHCTWAVNLCLTAVSVAIISLVWLALCNF